MEKFPPLPPIKGRFSNFGEILPKIPEGILGHFTVLEKFCREFLFRHRGPIRIHLCREGVRGDTKRRQGSTSGTGVHRQGQFGLEFGGEGHKITSPELLCPDLSEVPVALIFVWTGLHIYGVNGFHPNLLLISKNPMDWTNEYSRRQSRKLSGPGLNFY